MNRGRRRLIAGRFLVGTAAALALATVASRWIMTVLQLKSGWTFTIAQGTVSVHPPGSVQPLTSPGAGGFICTDSDPPGLEWWLAPRGGGEAAFGVLRILQFATPVGGYPRWEFLLWPLSVSTALAGILLVRSGSRLAGLIRQGRICPLCTSNRGGLGPDQPCPECGTLPAR